jgi:hypothetical protein
MGPAVSAARDFGASLFNDKWVSVLLLQAKGGAFKYCLSPNKRRSEDRLPMQPGPGLMPFEISGGRIDPVRQVRHFSVATFDSPVL